MIAPGVSSMIRSTPVACSSARLLRDEALVLRLGGSRCLLALGDGLLARVELFLEALDGVVPFGERRLAADERLLEGGAGLPRPTGLALRLDQQLMGLLFRLEQ